MKKILQAIIYLFAFMGLVAVVNHNTAHAGWFEDIGKAIDGHVSDIKERITIDDAHVTGIDIAKTTFTFTKDAIHWAEGDVSVVRSIDGEYVQLEETFKSGLAPDLFIVLSDKVITNQAQLDAAPKTTLMKLTKGSGASYYKIPQELKLKTVVIWCKSFNQFMGSAIL